MKFYAESTNGFYDDAINTIIPSDAVQISDERYTSLLSDQYAGKKISLDANGVPVASFPVLSLAETQAQQIANLVAGYQQAIHQDVTITTVAGITKAYQADANSISNLHDMLSAFPDGTPPGFYWVSRDNTQVPFSFADLKALAMAMGTQGWTAFQHLQTQKNAVLAATTVAQAQAVVW